MNRRQNESGVLRGGKFFRGLFLTEVVGLTVIASHILWMVSNQSTRTVGFTRKIPLYAEFVKRILKIYGNKVERVGLIGQEYPVRDAETRTDVVS